MPKSLAPSWGDTLWLERSVTSHHTDLLDAQNKVLFDTLCAAKPRLLGIASAIDVLPGFHRKLVLHAGPPIGWDDMQPAMQAAVDSTALAMAVASGWPSRKKLTRSASCCGNASRSL